MCEWNGKCVSEREAVMRERKAFLIGVHWHIQLPHWFNVAGGNVETQAEKAAATHYPPPKVRRLREVGFPMERIRYNPKRGLFETTLHGDWAEAKMSSPRFVATHVEALADLKANPWEEVDG